MAWVMLSIFPLIALVLFARLALPTAVSITIIGGYLLLPTQTELDLPVLPPLNKHTIPALSALVLTAIHLGGRAPRPAGPSLPGWIPRSGFVRLCLVILLAGSFGTAVTNSDFLPLAARQALSPYDGFSIALQHLVMLIPFFLGRRILATAEAQRRMLAVLIVAALFYSLLALWEIRMSPQLNIQIYGFFPHAFIQHIRDGGFRPIVFLEHGLFVGIFLASAALAAAGMIRAARSGMERFVLVFAGVWLLGTIVLAKVLGALLITLLMAAVAFLLPRRMQMLAAVGVVVMVVLYPMLRAVDVVPVNHVVTVAEWIDPERAASLQYRLDNEDILLDRARERPLFGWGGFGRNRVYNQYGEDISTTDGYWVIVFGQGGWARYLGIFGLLSWCIITILFERRANLSPVAAALVLALTVNLIDLIPNSGISPLTWLMAGALVGRLERPQESDRVVAAGREKLSYGRAPREAGHGPEKSAAKGSQARPDPIIYSRQHSKGFGEKSS